MYIVILEDVKQGLPPGRKVMTLAEVAEQIDRTPMALLKLKERGNLTIPFKKNGGKWEISIYAYAKWLADGGEVEKPVQAVKVSVEPAKKKQRVGIPIGKILFGFMANIQQMQEQVDFYTELHYELERIELMRRIGELPPRPHVGI